MTCGGGLTRNAPSVACPSNYWERYASCRAGTGAMDWILSGDDANTRMTLFRVVTSIFLGPTYVGVRRPAARVSP